MVQGPFWPPLSPWDGRDGPTGIQNSSTQCIWVVRIHITRLGPLTDLYGTPGPVLAPKDPFEGPRGTWRARRVQIWSQLAPIGLTGLESWLPDTLTWYLASSGPPGPPKGPVLAPKGPFEGPRGTWRARRVQIWLSALLALILIGHTIRFAKIFNFGPILGPQGPQKDPFGLKRAQNGAKVENFRKPIV